MSSEKALYSIWSQKGNTLFSSRPGSLSTDIASQMAANFLCAGPSYYYVVELGLYRFVYVSPGITEVLGADPETLQIRDIVERVHPDDLPFFARCEEIILRFFLDKIPWEKRTQYKTSYTMRLRHDDGNYRLILHQAVAIELDSFGRMSRILGVHTDIGHLVSGVKRRLSLIHLGGGPSYLNIDVDQAEDPFRPQAFRHGFSMRELQVIRLFAEGHTADEVAALLHLSAGTVRTHRRNVLQKSGCANMTALVALCVREGWV